MLVKFPAVHFTNTKNQWKYFFGERNQRIIFLISLLALVLVLFLLSRFLLFIESRNGIAFNDPILNLFNPIDLTWFTFILIYTSVIFALIHLIDEPTKVLLAMQSYIVMVLIRIIAMYLLPLEPPKGMIILSDPFVEFFGTGQTLTRDLFFSGHTATLFLLFLVMDNRIVKGIFLMNVFLVGISVLAQHVHYTIDVLTAPFFAYVSFKLVNCIRSNNHR